MRCKSRTTHTNIMIYIISSMYCTLFVQVLSSICCLKRQTELHIYSEDSALYLPRHGAVQKSIDYYQTISTSSSKTESNVRWHPQINPGRYTFCCQSLNQLVLAVRLTMVNPHRTGGVGCKLQNLSTRGRSWLLFLKNHLLVARSRPKIDNQFHLRCVIMALWEPRCHTTSWKVVNRLSRDHWSQTKNVTSLW